MGTSREICKLCHQINAVGLSFQRPKRIAIQRRAQAELIKALVETIEAGKINGG